MITCVDAFCNIVPLCFLIPNIQMSKSNREAQCVGRAMWKGGQFIFSPVPRTHKGLSDTFIHPLFSHNIPSWWLSQHVSILVSAPTYSRKYIKKGRALSRAGNVSSSTAPLLTRDTTPSVVRTGSRADVSSAGCTVFSEWRTCGRHCAHFSWDLTKCELLLDSNVKGTPLSSFVAVQFAKVLCQSVPRKGTFCEEHHYEEHDCHSFFCSVILCFLIYFSFFDV